MKMLKQIYLTELLLLNSLNDRSRLSHENYFDCVKEKYWEVLIENKTCGFLGELVQPKFTPPLPPPPPPPQYSIMPEKEAAVNIRTY